jgi:hypothetical protein
MIDWKNLQPLPLSRQKDALDRERLAEIAHRKRCAKHRGRNHWRNWERRKMAAEQRKIATDKLAKSKAQHKRHVDLVRDYWAGLIDCHP